MNKRQTRPVFFFEKKMRALSEDSLGMRKTASFEMSERIVSLCQGYRTITHGELWLDFFSLFLLLEGSSGTYTTNLSQSMQS